MLAKYFTLWFIQPFSIEIIDPKLCQMVRLWHRIEKNLTYTSLQLELDIKVVLKTTALIHAAINEHWFDVIFKLLLPIDTRLSRYVLYMIH